MSFFLHLHSIEINATPNLLKLLQFPEVLIKRHMLNWLFSLGLTISYALNDNLICIRFVWADKNFYL